MIRNYIKIALRNLQRQKGFSIINILGLSIGLACAIIIMLYVQNELSYDTFHAKADKIYRITGQTTEVSVAICPAPMAPGMVNEFPEISSAVRVSMYANNLFDVGDQKFDETRVLYVDSNYFEVFDYQLLRGDRGTALKEAQSIILSKATSVKYFGDADPIGKTVKMDNHTDLTVTGVLAEVTNSHLQPDMLIPMSLLARTDNDLKNNTWDNFNFYGYVVTDKALSEAEMKTMDKRVDEFYNKHQSEFKINFHLQPLKSIHLHSNFMADVPGHGNSEYVFAFVVVAGFILIVACINFMNLSTARSARRAKEVGLRKVSGAVRSQLIGQFLSESLIIAFISLIVAVLVAYVSLRFVNDIAGKQLTLNLLDGKLIFVLIGIALTTGLVAGSYPALVLSGFMPAKVLKREVTSGSGGVIFRNVLVVMQFVVSVVLLAGTAVVYQQLNFIQNKSIGYTKENLVYFEMKGALWNDLSALKSRLQQNRFTEHYAFSTGVPTNLASGTVNVDWQGKDKDNQILFAHMAVDENFVDVMGMKMISGRDFSKDIPADTTNYIVNEAALRVMNMNAESAAGAPFTLWNRKGVIVGVVKDFNFKPLQKSVEPMVLRYNSWGGVVLVRTEPKNTRETLSSLEAICKELNPAYPFVYKYVDQDLANLYTNEQQVGKLFNVFAGLAIFISCLGLYGLSAFVAEQRTKEIGIRKALGASIPHIVQLLSTRFLIPIIIAIVIAAPIAFYVMNSWLQGFAYRVNFGWIVFASAGIIALMTGFLTISFECIKAARMNPVKSLRTE